MHFCQLYSKESGKTYSLEGSWRYCLKQISRGIFHQQLSVATFDGEAVPTTNWPNKACGGGSREPRAHLCIDQRAGGGSDLAESHHLRSRPAHSRVHVSQRGHLYRSTDIDCAGTAAAHRLYTNLNPRGAMAAIRPANGHYTGPGDGIRLLGKWVWTTGQRIRCGGKCCGQWVVGCGQQTGGKRFCAIW